MGATNAGSFWVADFLAPQPTRLRYRMATRETLNEFQKPEERDFVSLGTGELKKRLERSIRECVHAVEAKLDEDRAELRDLGGPSPSEFAIAKYLTLSRNLAPSIALGQQLRWGAFIEEDGSLSLVIQSILTDRRATWRLAPNQSVATVTKIDEQMQAEVSGFDPLDRKRTEELAEWVIRRA